MASEGSGRILVVDDDALIRETLATALGDEGYAVRVAPDGRAALSALGTWRPDVIVLDLGLPDMEGVAVLKRLREWSQTPVLVLSVRDREGDKVAALDNGADDYLTKPFGTAELLAHPPESASARAAQATASSRRRVCFQRTNVIHRRQQIRSHGDDLRSSVARALRPSSPAW